MRIRNRGRFTLVELLVVITIIAILASMLLPLLSRSKYLARNTLCISKLKQIGTTWLSYTSDFDQFYPDYGQASPNPIDVNDAARRRSHHLGSSNQFGTFDLRPVLREYLESLNDSMKCPLASPSWSSARGRTDFYDIDEYRLGSYTYSTYQLFPTGHAKTVDLSTSKQMRRAGESFRPNAGTASGKNFRLLAADFAWRRAWGFGESVILSSQPPHGGDAEEGGNRTNETLSWVVRTGYSTYANFASDDGSVRTYTDVRVSSVYEGSYYVTRGDYLGFLLPVDLAQ